jgi:hypothetical protein
VATIAAQIKRGFLNTLYRQATAGTQLIDILNEFQDYCFSPELKRGRLIQSSSGNQHSTSFQQFSTAFQLSQEQIFSLSQELIEVYGDSVAGLQAATPPIPEPTDDQIAAAMLQDDRLTSIRAFQTDYTATRFPTFGPGAGAGS